MSVVTIKYIRSKPKAAAHIRYITHRKGSEGGQKITRALFTDLELTDKQELYQTPEKAPRGTIFFKFMISPDPKREDTLKDLDLQQITRITIRKLERKLNRRFSFVATVHNDHAPHRHVHGIFLARGRLSRTAFRELQKTMRASATQEALLQRKARDLTRASLRYRPRVFVRRTNFRIRGGRLFPQTQPGCSSCGYGEFAGISAFRSYCPLCHTKLKQTQQAQLQLGGGR